MDEADLLGDRIAIINNGKLVIIHINHENNNGKLVKPI
jgi:ABC-type proline/glycine betaine transport system ATPase subunit